MYSFDESALVGELEALSSRARIAFAAAAATRQLGNYERLAHASEASSEQRPREIATQLWTDLLAAAVDRAAWSAKLDEVMSLLPEESDDWVIAHALADDALSSLAYAIRCLLTPEPQEAAWAARRAYEAADQAAIRVLGVQPGLPSTEPAIKSHGFVQRELARQRNDLSLLCADSVDEVQRQAFADELLTDQEAASLA
ncbi:MAG: hypothetical protein CVT66_11860 [Actinobacteria bacterium HGW-Actinobacteria-6]|jgi:uncharacterized protein YjaG (DUF416 family)|nr:MAG: hypothetical protein CVT66_11860 [Actinobacteria bacterium HGW-Actinobacteria-6]